MPISGIKVLTIGLKFQLPYDVLHLDQPDALFSTIATFKPDVIVTSTLVPEALNVAPFEIRKKWIHVDPDVAAEDLIRKIEACYTFNIWTRHPYQHVHPLISVFTPTCNALKYIAETCASVKAQTYTNWEWVVVDDCSDDGTWEKLVEFSKEDIRIRPFRSAARNARIGTVKDLATRLCRGEYLVELDHDDMLTDFALEEIKKAFESDPQIGFVYSNCANFFEDGSFHRYDGDFWQTYYRGTEYRGRIWLERVNPDIYDRFGPHYTDQFAWFLTVGPNHVRAFRAQTFRELGGYNPNLMVADDWDLFARFFLHSKCFHIDRMLYLYRFRDYRQNVTFQRNQAIQDHLELGRDHYAREFEIVNAKRLDAPALTLADVSYVIPEAVPQQCTVDCIKSIRKWSPRSEVVLVANGCDPLDEAKRLSDIVVRVEINSRFASGCNRGVMAATRKVVCIMNNDAEFVDDSPGRLVEAIRPGFPIVAPFSNRAKWPQGDLEKENAPAQSLHPESVVGVCVMMPAALYRELGGYDSRLDTWEDDDFCARARDLGHFCEVVGGTWVKHQRHATFDALQEDVQQIMSRNQKIFQRKHPGIKVIAISKDEEGCIAEFFAQFASVTTDWCLLDTGSTDRTIEIAGSKGANVESTVFRDFAAARNEALSRFARDADWIIMMDPDERLDPHTIRHIKELVFRTEFDMFLSPLQAVYVNGGRKDFVPKPFLFRNRPEIHWTFKVHEKLIGSRNQALLKNALIEHLLVKHESSRRQESWNLYESLSRQEPYFSDPEFQRNILSDWPILDYDRMDDDRIKKIFTGPLISVVIPTYKRPALLRKAVDSALNQDYANLEVVVVGDNDPALSSFNPGSERVRVFNLSRNHGAGGAVPRNVGITMSAGKWIAYLDDDNEWMPDHVSSIFELMRSRDAAYGMSSMQVEGVDLGFTEPKFQGMDTSCFIHRKDLVEKYGWWKDRAEGGYAHDWEFVRRWVEGKEKWISTGKPTLLYNTASSGQAEFLRSRMIHQSGKNVL